MAVQCTDTPATSALAYLLLNGKADHLTESLVPTGKSSTSLASSAAVDVPLQLQGATWGFNQSRFTYIKANGSACDGPYYQPVSAGEPVLSTLHHRTQTQVCFCVFVLAWDKYISVRIHFLLKL